MKAEAQLPKPLGPGSQTWKDFGSYLFHLMLPQAFILQSAHPVINGAVTKDKKYLNDPWGRAKNSTNLLWPVVYSRPEKAIDMGISLRELHRNVKGTDKQGKKYFGLDPEAYAWVHMTGFDATLRMYEYFGRAPNAQQRKVMFEEWRQMGFMLGVDPRQLPATEAEYWSQFNDMIDNKLVFGEAVLDLLNPNYFRDYPAPPKAGKTSARFWKVLNWLPGLALHKIAVITLPENYRARFGIRVSKTDRFLFRIFAGLVKLFYPLLPESKRYIPLAYRAIKDARNHPEAYQWNPEQVSEQAVSA